MPIEIVSSTDSEADVLAAQGGQKPEKADDTQTQAEPKDEPVLEQSASAKKPDESAEDSDPSEEDESEEDELDDEKPAKTANKKSGFSRRLKRLTAQRREAERERDHWRDQALRGQSLDSDQQSRKDEKPQEKSQRPKSENFENHDEYVEALTEWKLEQRLADRDAKQKELEAKASEQKREATHWEKVEEFGKTHEDFADTIADVDDIPMSLAVRDAILSSDNGPELMYELAKNRAEYKRINALPLVQATRELVKFEGKFSGQKTAGEKSSSSTETKQTKAPRPVNPVGSNATSSAKKTVYDEDISQREFERLYKEQVPLRDF